jgi:hypothetical protein
MNAKVNRRGDTLIVRVLDRPAGVALSWDDDATLNGLLETALRQLGELSGALSANIKFDPAEVAIAVPFGTLRGARDASDAAQAIVAGLLDGPTPQS